jgi:hypothetical protein
MPLVDLRSETIADPDRERPDDMADVETVDQLEAMEAVAHDQIEVASEGDDLRRFRFGHVPAPKKDGPNATWPMNC